MAAPNYHNFVYTQSANPGHQQFETIGHPGRYTGVFPFRGGEMYFTGSNYGYGALFLGSGSSLIACEKMDRICYGMELDTKYCDVIIERWEQFTGQKATKL